jgi:hypothetical protein
MAWVAVIGLALGAMGSSSSGKSAKKAAAQEAMFRDRELRLAEQQEGRANQLWREYQTTYLPRERQLIESTFSEQESPEAAAARATSDMRRVSAVNRESQLRNARRLGINPNSGAYTALDTSRTLGEVGMEAAARDSARRTAKDINFTRQHSVLSLGRNLPATAGSMTNSAGAVYGSLASVAGRRADQANQMSAAAGQQTGYYGGMLADWYRRRQGSPGTGMSDGTDQSWGRQAVAAGVS